MTVRVDSACVHRGMCPRLLGPDTVVQVGERFEAPRHPHLVNHGAASVRLSTHEG